MVSYGDLQFAERIMVARRSEMSAEWKVRFAICIASVAIQAFTKLLFSFSDILKTTNCTFQEVDNIFCLAVGIAVYDDFFSCMCAAFRKPKSLKDILVRADTSPRSAYNGQCQKCDSRRCMTCKNIQCTHKFSSTHTGEQFIIYCNANCNGCHLLLDVCTIYFISCDCIMNNSSLSYPIY